MGAGTDHRGAWSICYGRQEGPGRNTGRHRNPGQMKLRMPRICRSVGPSDPVSERRRNRAGVSGGMGRTHPEASDYCGCPAIRPARSHGIWLLALLLRVPRPHGDASQPFLPPRPPDFLPPISAIALAQLGGSTSIPRRRGRGPRRSTQRWSGTFARKASQARPMPIYYRWHAELDTSTGA